MAESPSVAVRILADLNGLKNAVAGVAGHAQDMAGKMGSAFHSVLGTLNQTGVLGPFGEALDKVGAGVEALSEKHKAMSTTLMGVGAAAVGAGAVLSEMGSKDQAAHAQLKQAIDATGKSYDDYAGQIDKAVKHQENYGHTASQTQDALRIMTQAMGDPAKALQYLGEASDLAAAKHESLDAAATQLSRTYNGANKLLKEFGVETLPKASAEQKALDTATKAAGAAVNAQAAAQQHLADVHALLAGKTHLTTQEQITLRDANDKLQAANLAVITTHNQVVTAQDNVSKSANNQATTMTELGNKIKGQAAAAADTWSGKLDALKAKIEDHIATLGQKYGPAISAAGAVMTGMGATLQLMQALHLADAAGWLLDAAAAAAAAVAENLALLGIPILIAAVVAGIAWMVTHWHQVTDAAKEVWDWISSHWPLLLAILTGPFGLAIYEIVGHWQDLMGFFRGLVNDVRGIFDSIWGGIVDAFKAVINGVIDVWNQLHFTLPKVDILGVHIGGETIGVPPISHFAAGGLVTGPTLALLGEAGPERVTPLTGPHAGPAVHIENVNVRDNADVSLLLAQIHFATMAGKL